MPGWRFKTGQRPLSRLNMANKFLGIGAGVEQKKSANSLSERAYKIKSMFGLHVEGIRRTLQQAKEIGLELIEAKDQCVREQQEWHAWLKTVGIPPARAAAYMRIAE